MRKIHLLAALGVLLAAPAAAQDWHTAFGIQGGFSRFQLTGTGPSGKLDLYGIPTNNIISVYPTAGAAFAILSVGDKLALEPSLTFEQQNFGTSGLPSTVAAAGLRFDYAVTHQFYAALGLYTRYWSIAGPSANSSFQLGLQAGAGYRLHLTSRLEGRVEAQAITVKKTDNNAPFNVYSLLFGLSTSLESAHRPAATRARPAHTGAWEPVLGVAAGYSQVHINRGADATILSFPGAGASSYPGITIAPSAPSIFGLFPLSERVALEIGMDFTDIRGGTSSIASAQLAPRIDWAVGERWYAALGPSMHFVRNNTAAFRSTVGIAGAGIAWGYRFHLAGAMGGRIEANYGITVGRNQTPSAVGHGSTGAFGLTFGALFPLN